MKKCCIALKDRYGIPGVEERDKEKKCHFLEITAVCRVCLFITIKNTSIGVVMLQCFKW